MDDFHTILPLRAAFLYTSRIAFFNELTASIEDYPFFVQRTSLHLCWRSYRDLSQRRLPFLVSFHPFREFLVSRLYQTSSELFSAHQILQAIFLPLDSITVVLASDISTRIPDVFTPSYLPLGSTLSFVPPPGSLPVSDPLGSALLAFRHCFSL